MSKMNRLSIVSTLVVASSILLTSGLSPVHAALPSCSTVPGGSKSGSKSIGYGNEWAGITGSVNGSASFRAQDCISTLGLPLRRHAKGSANINVDARLIRFTIAKVFNAAASVSSQATGTSASLVVKLFGTTVFSQTGSTQRTFGGLSSTSSISKSLDVSLLGVGVKFSASLSLTRSGSITVTPAALVRVTSTLALRANATAKATGGVPCARIELTATLAKILGLRMTANLSVGFTSATGGVTLTVDPVSFLLKVCLAVCLAPDPCSTLVNTSFGGFSATVYKF